MAPRLIKSNMTLKHRNVLSVIIRRLSFAMSRLTAALWLSVLCVAASTTTAHGEPTLSSRGFGVAFMLLHSSDKSVKASVEAAIPVHLLPQAPMRKHWTRPRSRAWTRYLRR